MDQVVRQKRSQQNAMGKNEWTGHAGVAGRVHDSEPVALGVSVLLALSLTVVVG